MKLSHVTTTLTLALVSTIATMNANAFSLFGLGGGDQAAPVTTAAPAPEFTGWADPHRFALQARMNDTIQPGLFQVSGGEFPGDNTQISQGTRWRPEVGAIYYLTHKVAVELDATLGTVNNPTTGLFMTGVPTDPFGYKPSVLDLQYHFDPVMGGRFTPYAGAGVTYMRLTGAPAWGKNFFVTPGSAWGENVEVGGDFAITEHWSVNLNARKYYVRTGWQDAMGIEMGMVPETFPNRVKLDPTVLGVGIGYRF